MKSIRALITVREVLCKSIISRCGITGIDYSINPYIGCQHACAYCYARFMAIHHGSGEKWGEFVDVKVNAPQVVLKQLQRIRRGLTWISSVTDPYQGVEAKYKLTQQILECLLQYQFPVTVLTKSKLVIRDLPLFSQFEECEVGLTVVTLDETIRAEFEPNSSSISDRLAALRILHEAGIRSYAFVGPLLPFLSEECIDELAIRFKEVAVRRVLIDRLNIKYGNWLTIEKALRRCRPELVSKYREVLFSPSTYYDELKARVGNIFSKRGLSFAFCY